MRKLLKFKKALGFYNDVDKTLIVLLEDGRYGSIFTARENAPKDILKGHIGGFKESYLRGKELNEDIPEEIIKKAKNILEDINSKIRISN